MSQVLLGRAFPWHGTQTSLIMFRGIATLSGHGAVTVTPRKKSGKPVGTGSAGRLGLGSRRYQGTQASASPPRGLTASILPLGLMALLPLATVFPRHLQTLAATTGPQGEPCWAWVGLQ